jgi:hypothetical protein
LSKGNMKLKWIYISAFLIFSILICLCLLGCSYNTSIVGYWQSTEDESAYIEFVEDGKLIIDTGEHIVTGTYETLSENYIKVDIDGLVGLFLPLFSNDTWKYDVTKKGLILSVDNDSELFKRVK